MVYKNFDKKTGSVASINEELAHELHKPAIKKFKRRKVYVNFKNNIWATDLTEMGSLSSFNGGIKYLFVYLFICNIYWVRPLKDKKAKTVFHSFIEIVNESKPVPNELCVDQGRKFCNNPM